MLSWHLVGSNHANPFNGCHPLAASILETYLRSFAYLREDGSKVSLLSRGEGSMRC